MGPIFRGAVWVGVWLVWEGECAVLSLWVCAEGDLCKRDLLMWQKRPIQCAVLSVWVCAEGDLCIHVCACTVYACIRILCTHVHTCKLHVYMYIYMCVCVCVCIYIYIFIYIHVRVCVCVCVYRVALQVQRSGMAAPVYA